jgi:hypothetical protein
VPPFQAVIPTPFDNNSALTQYARVAAKALQAYGTEAVLFDTSVLPLGLDDEALARLVYEKLLSLRPKGAQQVYVNLVPDMRYGFTSYPGYLARISLDDPDLRVCSYIHEFTEGVRRFGEAQTLSLQYQQFPTAFLAPLATTTEFESRHLGHYVTLPNGFSLLPVLVPRLRKRHLIPMPPIVPPSPQAQKQLEKKFTSPGPTRLAILGGFRPFKGTDPESGLGLYHLLDSLARRVRQGALPNDWVLQVAGRLSDTSRVEAIPGGRDAPVTRCLEKLFSLDDRARELLAAYLAHPSDAASARALETHLESSCARYPFRIRLHFDRDDAWISEHVMAPAHLGILLSNRGICLRNSALLNFAAHRIPVLANIGDECPEELRPHLIKAYEEADREAAIAAGDLDAFLTRSMDQAAETCTHLLQNPGALASHADRTWEAMGRPSAHEHARMLTEWFLDVLAQRYTPREHWRVKGMWSAVVPLANRSCKDLLHHPEPRKNTLQHLIDAARRIGLLRTPLSPK